MEKFKLSLIMLAVIVATLAAVIKFLLFELEESWYFAACPGSFGAAENTPNRSGGLGV